MAVYTFHVPAGAGRGDARALERAVLVRDGFSWGALVFQVLWCLWNRLWLVALGFLAVGLVLTFALEWAGLPDVAVGAASLLLALLFAFEANNLRRLSLERRGLEARGVVVAPDRLEAERRAFSIWLAGGGQEDGQGQEASAPVAPVSPRAAPARADRDPQVIGLFPAAEEPR